MDLSKIIGELRLELQCLDTAIASMEELARVQSLNEAVGRELPALRELSTAEGEPPGDEPPPVKRRRGRPPKKANPVEPEEPPQMVTTGSSDDPSASAA